MSYKFKVTDFSFYLFTFLFVCNALEAYNLVIVPFQWISQLGIIILALWVTLRKGLRVFPGFVYLILFFTWATSVTLIQTAFGSYENMMASGATTSYNLYIALRVLVILSFSSAIVVVYWLCTQGYKDRIFNMIVKLGLIVSIYALYVYLAQIFGLPEIPRSRIGTSGGEQGTTFSYAFHRALGSFREPSHLAEWLVLPLLLSYTQSKSLLSWRTVVMSSVILLSGSLTGLGGVILGFIFAFLANTNLKLKSISQAFRIFLPFFGAFFIFSFLVMSNTPDGDVDLLTTLWERVVPLIEGGAEESNRSYVYEYTATHAYPVLGHGLGNANIIFGHALKLDSTASFLNLFLTLLYSTGIIGVFLILLFLLYPLWQHFYRNKGFSGESFTYIFAAFLAWGFMFFVHAEELTFSFAICYAITIFTIINFRKTKRRKGEKVRTHL